MPRLSIVVPVYKAASCLAELNRRLSAACSAVTEDFEIVLVEDGGEDGSWPIIERMAEADARVKGIQLSRNFGQHYAITAGLDASDGDWTVVMDCDLQDRPEEIPRLYQAAQQGFDVVVARRGRRRDSAFRRWTSDLFYRAFRYLTDMQYDAEVGNFRIMSRQVVENFRTMREQLRFFGGLMTWIGFSVGSVDVEHGERFAGETSYSWRKLRKLAINTVLAYSDKPLRLAIRFGFLIAFAAVIGAVFVFYRAVRDDVTVSGWSSLIISLYFLFGVLISLLGIVGLYLGKVFDEAKRRPLYIVRRSTFAVTRQA